MIYSLLGTSPSVGKTIKSKTLGEYSIVHFKNSTDVGYDEAINIYRDLIPDECKSSSADIVYWVDNGGQVSNCVECYFIGLNKNDKIIGIVHWSSFDRLGFGFIDYFAILPEYRNMITLLKFRQIFDAMVDFFGLKFLVTEIVKNPLLERFAAMSGFTRIDADYFQPDYSNHIDAWDKASLMISKGQNVSRVESLAIISSIYRDYYLPWYSPFSSYSEYTSFNDRLDAVLNRFVW